jgi:hypothetical protein
MKASISSADTLQTPQPIPRAIDCQPRRLSPAPSGHVISELVCTQSFAGRIRRRPPGDTLLAGGIGCRSLMQLIY